MTKTISRGTSSADACSEDDEAVKEISLLLRRFMETVRKGVNIQALQKAISLLQDALGNRAHSDENRSIVHYHLRRALLLRFSIYGWLEDLEACYPRDEDTNIIVTVRGCLDQDIGIQEMQSAIGLLRECQQSIDFKTLDDVIWIAEETLSLYTNGSSLLERAKLLITLAKAFILKRVNTFGDPELTCVAEKFQEAEQLCIREPSWASIALISLAHIGWLRLTECGLQEGLEDIDNCMEKLATIDEGRRPWNDGMAILEGDVDASQLQFAINCFFTSLSHRMVPHPQRPRTLSYLANAFLTRFDLRGNQRDLGHSIAVQWESLKLLPAPHPNRAMTLNNLASSVFRRFEMLGTMKDLQDCIVLQRESLELTPVKASTRLRSLRILGTALKARFDQQNDADDIDEAVSIFHKLLSMTDSLHPDRAESLTSLAGAHFARFKQSGNFQDIEDSIVLLQEARALTPTSAILSQLGNGFYMRFKQKGDSRDIEESIMFHRNALNLRSTGDPGRYTSLNNLALPLHARYVLLGNIQDLEECISLERQALGLSAGSYSDRASILSNLAGSLHTLFKQKGDSKDLEECIAIHREALGLIPTSHPDRILLLLNMGSALNTRFEQKGISRDLTECISLYREALASCSQTHPERPILLNNLASCFWRRSKRTGTFQAQDLEESINLAREALTLLHASHSFRCLALNTLGTNLFTRFEQMGNPCDIEESVAVYREALHLQPSPHPDHIISLKNLASSLFTNYMQTAKFEDLEECIKLYNQTLSLQPAPHPSRILSLRNLANAHTQRFRQRNDDADLEQSLYYYEAGAKYETGSLLLRLNSSKGWALGCKVFHRGSALDAYQYTMELLPQLASLDITLQQRQDVLENSRELVGEATKCAIDENQFDAAVVFLSTGRSIFWSQALQLRTPVDKLAVVDRQLAEKYLDISKQLEQASHNQENQGQYKRSADLQSAPVTYTGLSDLVDQRHQVIEEIRRIQGFEEFLLPPSIASLQLAAREGPIVLLNASFSGCDALIMRAEMPIQHIPLHVLPKHLEALKEGIHHLLAPGLRSVDTAQATADVVANWLPRDMARDTPIAPDSSQDIFRLVLAGLWFKVVQPILEALEIEKTESPGRIWWCPTGSFASLPIHAAGLYSWDDDCEPIDCLFQYAVSSYCTSPQDLLHPSQTTPSFIMTAVIEPEAPGGAPLYAAIDELSNIEAHIPNQGRLVARVGLKTAPNLIEDVLSDIQRSSFVHFGCHGTQNLDNPLESYLLLSGGKLTASKIIEECRVPEGAFAYLSACETAKGDEVRPDESLNLVATMMFSGFRGVVGTMWSILDHDAPIVAGVFYKHMFRNDNDTLPNVRDAAYGLHLAMKKLREDRKPFSSWVPYVHYGI